MNINTYQEAIEFLSSNDQITFNDSFDLSKLCSKLLRDKERENQARDLIIRVRDSWNKLDMETKNVWNDLTEAAGLYPYIDPNTTSSSGLLRYEYHQSPSLPGVYLHSEQQVLSLQLLEKRSVVVSAPTSFGKSLLIEEIIASRVYTNIVIIQPTLALLDETRKKLSKYKELYKVIVSTNQEPDQELGNIFLFTGERAVEYGNFPKIDFFVIDEFYKLSLDRDDDRAITLNQAFHKLLKHTNKFYMLGPMIKSIPTAFKERFEFTWLHTNYSTVAVDEVDLHITDKLKAQEKKELKIKNLFELLDSEKEPTLIYCSSPNKATQLSLDYVRHILDSKTDNQNFEKENSEIIEWLGENINSNWSMINALKIGIGVHHGALPRHLGSSIVDLFNEGSIKHLFCTSTLIEGVNTSAKNVILFDKQKGRKKIDFFDYKNIAGRSGRMKKHFVGKVFRFETEPEQMELFVDIPLFNQPDAPLEVLINLDEHEIEESVKDRVSEFNELPDDLKAILKKHASLGIDGQLSIVKLIEERVNEYSQLLTWSSFPTYEQLLTVIELAWDNLLKKDENKADVRSAAQLTVLTLKYSNLQSLSALINDTANSTYWIRNHQNTQERIDRATFYILNITRHWFDYKLPKWLSIISDLQEYVFSKHNIEPGDYSYYASSIEHGFLQTNLAALMEYDIPSSAIRKLRKSLNPDRAPEVLIQFLHGLTREELKARGLIDYEISKIKNAL
jgi:superfamily II DNA/RNA helicase